MPKGYVDLSSGLRFLLSPINDMKAVLSSAELALGYAGDTSTGARQLLRP